MCIGHCIWSDKTLPKPKLSVDFHQPFWSSEIGHDNPMAGNMEDVGNVARLFGIDYPDPRYNPNHDIDYDMKINMADIGTVARHFEETDP